MTRGRTSRPARARLRIGFQVWGQQVGWAELMAAGAAIDRLGFDGLWSNDHLMPVVGGRDRLVELPGGPVWDGWMTLMGWAARTERVSLGVMVSSAAYRSPALLVKMATALDHESGGRAILGLGAGWNATEHRAFGFDYPSLRERLDRLDEASAICRQMLDGQAAHLAGHWYRAEGACNDPAPLSSRLLLLIGGSGERRTLPIVARDADAWNGEGDPATYGRKNALLDELCRDLGREPSAVRRTVGLPPPLIRPDRSEATELLARALVGHGLDEAEALAVAQESPLVGPAARIEHELRAYQEAGAQEVVFDWPMPSDEATLTALAGPVRKALAS